jgi:GH25 family lysozyme M1 (1,4-beta-N-acetylmuramidase)
MTKRKQLRRCVILAVLTGVLLAGCLPPPVQGPAPGTEAVTPTVPETTLPPPTENVFTPMDFGYEGDYLTCLTDESQLGIDVSKFQGEIDWEKVKEAGVEFAMIRVGFRGYGQSGKLVEDVNAKKNYENATKAGIKVGVYFFAQAITVEEAKEEAEYVLGLIDGWQLDMPIAYDWECLAADYRTAGADPQTVTDCAKAFCQTIEEGGLEAMVYFNVQYACHGMYLEELTDYQFWLAMYNSRMDFPYRIDMWQHTDHGSVPGIEGPVDLNIYFLPDEA